MSLPAPEQALVNDGAALATSALTTLQSGITSWLAGTITAVPKVTADLVPAMTGYIENLAPAKAQPYLVMLFGLVDTAATSILTPVDAEIVSGIHLAQANITAALTNLESKV